MSLTNGFALFVFATLLLQFLLHPIRIGSDPAASLQCAKLTLAGAMPYKDYLVPQTPMQIYMALSPAALGNIFHLEPIFCFDICVLILAIASFWYTHHLVTTTKYRAAPGVEFSFAIAFAGLNLMLLFEFGQSQHLFLLLAVPYFVLRWLRMQEQPLTKRDAIVTGILAGIACNITLFFLPMLLVGELFLLVWHRRPRLLIRPELLSLLVFTALYLAHIWLLPASIREPLVKYVPTLSWCPFILDLRLRFAPNGVVRKELIYVFALTCAITISLGSRFPRIFKEQPLAPLAVLNVCGFSLFVLLQRGFSAHAVVFMFAGLAIANLAVFNLRLWGKKHPKTLHKWLAIALTLFFCRVALMQTRRDLVDIAMHRFDYIRTDYNAMSEILYHHSGVDDGVLLLTMHEYPAFPIILQMRRRPVTFLLHGEPLLQMGRLDNELATMLFLHIKPYEDHERLLTRLKGQILTERPKLIFVQGEELQTQMKQSGIQKILDNNYICFAVTDITYYDKSLVSKQHVTEHSGFQESTECYQLKAQPKVLAKEKGTH